MGAALQLITGRATNPAALTALTPNTGDSFSVQNFPFGETAELLNVWGLSATAGFVRIHSPKMHDNVQGIRGKVLAATPIPLLPDVVEQPLFAQDVLVFEQQGGGAETDLASMLIYYSNLAGASARLFDWATLKPRVANILTSEVTCVSGATLGDYSGGVAVDSTFGLLKGNTDYAILGYNTDTSVCSVGIRGIDTSNFRVGGPGSSSRIETRDWFTSLAEQTGLPTIPVFNSANKLGTIVDIAHNANAVSVVVDLILAELHS